MDGGSDGWMDAVCDDTSAENVRPTSSTWLRSSGGISSITAYNSSVADGNRLTTLIVNFSNLNYYKIQIKNMFFSGAAPVVGDCVIG